MTNGLQDGRRSFLKAGGALGLAAATSAIAQVPGAPFLVTSSSDVLIPRGRQRRVVICGGGWGGLNAAKQLRLLAPDLEVVLVERKVKHALVRFEFENAREIGGDNLFLISVFPGKEVVIPTGGALPGSIPIPLHGEDCSTSSRAMRQERNAILRSPVRLPRECMGQSGVAQGACPLGRSS